MSNEATIVLIAVGMLFLYVILNGIKTFRKHASFSWIPFILLIIGVLFLIVVLYRGQELKGADWAQILLMIGLVTITAVYAYSTEKMAEEIKEQRYAAARPKIDIQRDIDVADVARQTLEANAALSEDTSHGLSCILHNIGVGPAIDVHSFIQHPERGRLPWNFVTLAAGGKTERKNFSLKHENNRMALVAYYKDIYDQVFESSREVSIDKVGNAKWEIGPLKTIPVKEVESND